MATEETQGPHTVAPKPLTTSHWSILTSALRSNSRPPNLDHVVSGVDRGVIDCNQEISRLFMEVTTLENSLKDLQEYKMVWKSSISPIRKLPPEILTEIFVCFTACTDLRLYLNRSNVHCCGLIISAVCAYWRSMALATPALWSKFTVYDSDSRHAGIMNLVDTIVGRADKLPLTFHFTDMWTEENELPSLLSETLELVPDRWRQCSLELSIINWHYASSFLQKTHFPRLETVNIDIQIDDIDADYSFFEHAPKLHHATLHLTSEVQLHLPWSQIAHLEITRAWPSYDVAYPSLTNLQHLSVTPGDMYYFQTSSTSVLNLTSLSIKMDGCDALEKFFKLLTLPSLSCLSIGSREWDIPLSNSPHSWPQLFPLNELASLITRSSATVTQLSLTYTPGTTIRFMPIIELFPHLVKLSISEYSPRSYLCSDDEPGPHPSSSEINNDLLQRLTLYSNRGSRILQAFLPQLKDFSLATFDGAFSDDILVTMLRSRLFGGNNSRFSSLTRCRIRIHSRKLHFTALENLKKLLDARWDVAVTDKTGRVV